MHERALFRDLMRRITAIAEAEGAERVTAIAVRLGPFSHLDPAHFMEHFDWESRGTVAEGAEVAFEPWQEGGDARADGVVLASVQVGVRETGPR